MTIDGATSENYDPPTRARAHLFTVRLWKEGPADADYRGNVREVASGAYRNFRDWSDLTAFMCARLEETSTTRVERTEGER